MTSSPKWNLNMPINFHRLTFKLYMKYLDTYTESCHWWSQPHKERIHALVVKLYGDVRGKLKRLMALPEYYSHISNPEVIHGERENSVHHSAKSCLWCNWMAQEIPYQVKCIVFTATKVC